jgi:hypothetical protein
MLSIDTTPQSRSFWAGILNGKRTPELMSRARNALRVGWTKVSEWLPGSIDAFIDIHAAEFAYYTEPQEHAWADPFMANAPVTARVRWIRTVARHLDRAGKSPDDLLFEHWRHRLAGQPPIEDPEQLAFLEWITIPGIDVNKAAALFTSGPIAAAEDEDSGFGYYDLERFPTGHDPAFLKVAVHLLRGHTELPHFVGQIVQRATDAGDEHSQLTREVWSQLLRLGYGPAREQLNDQ